jgi:hypothetical protein
MSDTEIMPASVSASRQIGGIDLAVPAADRSAADRALGLDPAG